MWWSCELERERGAERCDFPCGNVLDPHPIRSIIQQSTGPCWIQGVQDVGMKLFVVLDVAMSLDDGTVVVEVWEAEQRCSVTSN